MPSDQVELIDINAKTGPMVRKFLTDRPGLRLPLRRCLRELLGLYWQIENEGRLPSLLGELESMEIDVNALGFEMPTVSCATACALVEIECEGGCDDCG